MTDKPISPLRQRMIEDMTVRHFAEKAQKDYIRYVKNFAAFLGRSPDAATAEDLRLFQQHMTKATRLRCPSEAAYPQLQPVARPLSCPRDTRLLVVGLLIA